MRFGSATEANRMQKPTGGDNWRGVTRRGEAQSPDRNSWPGRDHTPAGQDRRPGGRRDRRLPGLHAAQRRRSPYRNLVEQMQSGAVVLTAHGEILYANACFAALVGEPLSQ